MTSALIRRLATRRRGKSILCAAVDAYDRVLCTPRAVALQAKRKIRAGGRRFSVAIAHYNRGFRIHYPLFNLLDHPAVDDIVIVDDGSEEAQFRAMQAFVDSLGAGGRIKVYRRSENLGALITKGEAVGLAEKDKVLVLDSDNTASRRYLDALAAQDSSDEVFRCASWAFPFFSFRELEGNILDFAAVSRAVRSGVLRRAYIINDGNYLVPKKGYIETVASLGSAGKDGADVMLVNYRWLTTGGALHVIPRTSYLHRIAAGSLYEETRDESRCKILEMFARFEKGLPCNEDYIAGLQTAERYV